MRLSITYDLGGNITSIIGSPTGMPTARLEVRKGESIAEIEVPDVRQPMSKYFDDLVKNHRVALDGGIAKLARKQ